MDMPSGDWWPHIERMNADVLKRLVRGYGGPPNLRKDDCLGFLAKLLASPERLAEITRARQGDDALALALLKWLGNGMSSRSLGACLAAAGVRMLRRGSWSDALDDTVRALADRGTVLAVGSDYSHGYSGGFRHIIVDDRILEHVGRPEPAPIELPVVPAPERVRVRRPAAVMLGMQDFLGAVDRMGGLSLTQDGRIRVADVRKIAKAMDWGETQSFGAMELDDPVLLFVALLEGGGLLREDRMCLVVADSAGAGGAEPPAETVRRVLLGFAASGAWDESAEGREERWGHDSASLTSIRLALLVALRALSQPGEFHSFSQLDEALFQRMGEVFSLEYLLRRPDGRSSPREVQRWRLELRDNWSHKERVWLALAMGTWLHLLGIVELGGTQTDLDAFRITELGRQVLGIDPISDAAIGDTAPAWVVQPNFDVVVWLEHAGPQQMAFMARYAQRTAIRDHTAHYTLTREALHAGLQGGGSMEEFLSTLAAGSQAELPQNVMVEIHEWAQSRERLILHHQAKLLEFADLKQRDAALAAGVPGTAAGDTFILQAPGDAIDGQLGPMLGVEQIRYLRYSRPAKCVRALPDGTLQLGGGVYDLVLRGLLCRWCEKVTDETWRLTPKSVNRAMASGADARELQHFLETRLATSVPGLLSLAIRAWAGSKVRIGSQSVLMLRCAGREQAQALLREKSVAEGIVGLVGDDTLLVHEEDAQAVLARLEWAGITVEPVPKEPISGASG